MTLDTTRADHLGCYGHELAVTPTLDSLSTAGATFEWAICTTPVTLPSHSTILTGLSPLRHGVRDNGIFKLGPEFETVAERLLAANYQTGAFVSAYVLEHEYGTAQGFTTYDDQVVVERSAPITTRHAMAWMESLDRSRPYFLWLHLYDPHLPWIPPEPFASMDQLDPYDQEVAGMDKSLGDFFRRARSEGLLENTSVLLVGDHGEGLGGHGEPQHGVIFDPLRNELFTASRGSGAFLNDRRIRVSPRNGLSGAMLTTGFPPRDRANLHPQLGAIEALLRDAEDIRRTGSAALDLAYVACARSDGYFEAGLKPWDVAAGVLLVREAGGRCCDYFGGPDVIESGHLVAGNIKVADALQRSLVESGYAKVFRD